MNILLRAKHWQLFLLMIVPVLLSTSVMIFEYIKLFEQVKSQTAAIEQNIKQLIDASMWMLWGSLLSFLIYALWIWAVNMKLKNKLSPDLRDSPVRFNVVFVIPILYMLFIPLFMYYMVYDMVSVSLLTNSVAIDDSVSEEMLQKGKILLPIYFCLYLLLIPSFFYLVYRTGKILKTLETKTESTIGNFFVEIILVAFFPIIGVWLLQSKVNEYLKENDWDEGSTPPPY